MWTSADNTDINRNNICLIYEKLNELKRNALLKEKNLVFHSNETNQNVVD